MNIRLKLTFALFTLGTAGVALAANYKLNDVGFGSTFLEADQNVMNKITAACKGYGGRIVRWERGPTGKEGNRFYSWRTGHCNGAN